ncbi:D-glycero-D-manno-heptose 1,7-bisphosphate phosphatase [Dissulfuribacter thermophilus]|uniref:D,D-heptose 1,7-bisphosphate phosphatase n=1 Tax=Dissulfuribacter thermophilus TaxID=1156395 RepID=A0A1B9F590_9BACT|nr:HAD family hydrolase [Dissulfuribacter thermophilus]OCC15033.1 D-glycero-D-manno-heptose 1,7-bisphosphate phosphatase [Dissulfuribacter thermophilus]
MGKNAVFLDRDGTIIEDVNYLSDLRDITWIKGAKESIKALNEAGYQVVIVTNQSGIARGLLDESLLQRVHQAINDDLRHLGAHIDAFYYCPHHPDIGSPQYKKICSCRKPEPGLIYQASQDMDIDLERSFLIGDNLRDIEAGLRAGLTPILVLTGKGKDFKERILTVPTYKSIKIFPSIVEATRWILTSTWCF